MVGFSAVRTSTSKERIAEYTTKIDAMNLQELVKEFFTYLDYVDETESGREFKPIIISSCRVLMTQPLDILLTKLRSKVNAS